MGRWRKWLIAPAALIVMHAAMAGILVWLAGGWPEPKEMDSPILQGSWGEKVMDGMPARLNVVSYNIHFGVGREEDLDERREEAVIRENLAHIGQLLKNLKADVAVLQEVDFDSKRTYGIDEMRVIAEAAGLSYMAPVVTWKVGYLPYPYWPVSRHYGRMRSGQAVLSRFPILANRRVKLPKPAANPFWYNWFYIQRMLQQVRLDVKGRAVELFNVHAEAFDLPNRQIHAEMIRDYVRVHQGEWTILAGDFNAVPPEASKKKDFPDEPGCDMTSDKSVATMRELGFQEILPPGLYGHESVILTFPSNLPNRRLDYIYFSPSFQRIDGRVAGEAKTLSDHLPVTAELEWGTKK